MYVEPENKGLGRSVFFAFIMVVFLFRGNYVAIGFSDRELQPIWGAVLRLFSLR